MTIKQLISIVVLFTVSNSAFAVLVSVEPDAFAAGTNISNAYPGVSLSATGIQVEDGFVDADIFSTEANAVHPALTASTGTRIFNVNPVQLFPKDFLILEFRVDFDQPTNYVALDYIGFVDPDIPNSEDVGLGVLVAFDAADTLLMQVNTAGQGLILNEVETLELFRAAGDIAYITARSQGVDTPVLVDNLAYNVVPIPASVWLFVSALGLLATRLRR